MAPLEHEACAQDISELRWDLDNWLEEKKEMEKQVLAAVEKNKLLQNSIEELTAQWLVFSDRGLHKVSYSVINISSVLFDFIHIYSTSPNIKEKLEVDKKSLEGISADLKEVK